MSNLDDWDSEARYAVFDDMRPEGFLTRFQGMVGAQRTVVLTDKYRKKRTLQWGRPCIICCNRHNSPANTLSGAELEWWNANVITVYISAPLFN